MRSVKSKGKHDVQIYTRMASGILRAKDKQVLWRFGLSDTDAYDYLKSLFRSLERA